MKLKQAVVVLCAHLLIFLNLLSAQTVTLPSLANVVIPPAPEAAALAQYAETPVSLYTGQASVSVPLWTLAGRDLQVPISLSYHGGGIKVDQVASRAGLGWALNAGGVVTRSVRGKPDEVPGGWLSMASQIPAPQSNVPHEVKLSDYSSAEISFFMDIAKGDKDGQPDAFYVNMPGWSGQLVFDKNGIPRPVPYAKLKIEVNWGAKTWEITTPDGVRYLFGGAQATENSITFSDCGDSYGQPMITSWYLKQINSPNGDQVTFTYQSIGQIIQDLPRTETQYLAFATTSINPVCLGKAADICGGTVHTGNIRLSSVTSVHGSLEMVYATQGRTDLAGDYALEKVQVKKKNGTLLKEFVLAHSYFSGRLMLDTVTETAPSGAQLPPYSFDYYTSPGLPAKGSFSQDHWGYANGKPNNGSAVPFTQIYDCRSMGSADRLPSFLYSRSGSLKKITRPAGGQTTFDYEAHSYDQFPDSTIAVPAVVDADTHCYGGSCGAQVVKQFVIDKSQCVDLIVNLSNPGSFCDAEAKLYRQGGQVLRSFSCANSGVQTVSVLLSPGTYFIQANTYLNGDNASIRVNYTTQTPQKEILAGGIRIAKITDHDAYDSANDIVREFSYTFDGDPALPSGQIVTRPDYLHYLTETRSNGNSFENCKFVAISATTNQALGQTQGSHIGYAEVSELRGAGGSNGRIVSKFTSSQAHPNGAFGYPYGPVTDRDYLRGRLVEKTVFDSTGKKVTQELLAYTNRLENQEVIRGYNIAYFQRSPLSPNDPAANILYLRNFDIISQWSYLANTTTRTYADNGIDYAQTSTTNEYANPNHIQLTESRTTDSDGREIIQRFTYPEDYAVGSGDVAAEAITRLKVDQFMHSAPIEQTSWQKKPGGTEELLSGAITLYKTFAPGKILPERLLIFETNSPVSNYAPSAINSTFSYDNRYTERERVEAYGDYGNVLQVLQKDGIRASYKWGYDQSLPICKALNGSSAFSGNNAIEAETAYLGFESGAEINNNPNEDFWQFNSANASVGNARSGEFCREIAPGSQVFGPTRELRPGDQETRYVFSAWVKTPSNYGGGKLVIHSKADNSNNAVFPNSTQYNSFQTTTIPATSGKWEYLAVELDLGEIRSAASIGSALRLRAYVMNQDGSNALFVDDLRIQPRNARLQTMTYLPMIGLSSQANANDILGSFAYDPFLRLESAFDQDGNLIRHLDYQYAGQGNASHNQVTDNLAQVPVQTAAQLSALSIGDKYQNRQFLDGWGRPLQALQVGASPNGGDIVALSDYDQYGRAPKQWLPFAHANNQGAFVANSFARQAGFYQQTPAVAVDSAPFSQTVFDGSPLGRILEQSSPGQAFQLGSGHTQESAYLVNTPAHPVRKWVISGGNCISTGIYPVGELTAMRARDEDEGEFYEFKDKLGRVVYKKVKLLETDSKTQGGLGFSWLETYWVYNDFGQVAYVIPPKATAQMQGLSNFDVNALTADLVFEYKYDARQRVVEKKIPGKGWTYIVYDNLDRPILTQDGNLRAQNRWKFEKFDRLGRVTMTGIFNENVRTSRSALQAHVDGLLSAQTYENYEARIAATPALPYGYTAQSYPNSPDANGYYEIMSVSYYDDYDFDGDGTADVAYMADPDSEYSNESFYRLRDQVTRTQVRVLNRPAISAPVDFVFATSFFDKYGRTVHSQNIDHLGETELNYADFDFAGKLGKSKRVHKYALSGEIKVRNRFSYDQAGRLVNTFQQNNSDDEIMLSNKRYNALGQLMENNLHSTDNGQNFLQSVDYRYHIRGWMQQINDCNLANDYASGQRIWAVDDIRARFQVDTTQYGYRTIFLELEMDEHSNQTGELEYAERTALHQEALVNELEDSAAFAEALVLVGQNLTVQMQGASLHPAEFDNTVENAANELENEMENAGLKAGATTAGAALILRRAFALQVSGQYANDDNDDLFGMRLHFEDGMPNLRGDALHTGNISGICWKSKSDGIQRGYGFRYDQIGRLREARYAAKPLSGTKWSIETGHYDVPEIRYDFNGNITKVKRNGWFSSGSFGLMDNLTYAYNGNQLSAVTDQITATGPEDFRDNGATGAVDYTYDANGNLISDANKGLSVTYNHLNLPERMDFGGGDEILLLYDAAGTKLAKRVKQGGSPQPIRQYLAGFVYNGTTLEFFATPEGRVVPDQGAQDFRYAYHYRDHLGNTRLCFSDLDGDGQAEETEIMQELHYYPFGMQLGGLGTPQIGAPHLYGYNGKERQEEFGLGWSDYGARMYDAGLGRFVTVDPVSETLMDESPYHYAHNNPIFMIDVGGLSGEPHYKGKTNKARVYTTVTGYPVKQNGVETVIHVVTQTMYFSRENYRNETPRWNQVKGDRHLVSKESVRYRISSAISADGELLGTNARKDYVRSEFDGSGSKVSTEHFSDQREIGLDDPILSDGMKGTIQSVQEFAAGEANPGATMLGSERAKLDQYWTMIGAGATVAGYFGRSIPIVNSMSLVTGGLAAVRAGVSMLEGDHLGHPYHDHKKLVYIAKMLEQIYSSVLENAAVQKELSFEAFDSKIHEFR